MTNAFIDGFRDKIESLEQTDPLQKANFDLLQLVSDAMIGKVFGQEYELKMLEIKTRIAILEREEHKNVSNSSKVTPQSAANSKNNKTTKVYGENWIVIQNRLLNAITNLNLNERRLIMFLSPMVRKHVDKDPNQRIFYVRTKDFVKEYGIKSKAYYGELAKIADSILEKAFFFWYEHEGGKAKKGVSWVSECDYIENEGVIKIKLDDTVIEMLTVFDRANPFTKYERKQIVNLGSYGVILFELIASCMHQQHRQKAYTVEYLREKFNCVDTYPVISEFKRNVIDKAIKEIEKNTSYRISYAQKKKGRVIYEIVFSFKDQKEKTLKDKDKNSVERAHHTFNTNKNKKNIPSWQTKGLSDAQIKKLAIYTKDFVDANSSKVSPKDRRGYPAVFNDWKPLLKDPKTVVKFNMIQEILDR